MRSGSRWPRKFSPWVGLAISVHLLLGTLAFRLAPDRPDVPQEGKASLYGALFELASLEPPSPEPEVGHPIAPTVRGAEIGHGKALSRPHPTVEDTGVSEGASGPGPSSSGIAVVHGIPDKSVRPSLLGDNTPGRPGKINLNLSQPDVRAVVGEAELQRMTTEDANRRTAERRARWAAADLAQWRSAIEGYVPSVRLGNQRPLAGAQGSFLRYLKGMAARIAPILVDRFLSWIRSLPADHPLRGPQLSVRLEIVLDRSEGHIVRMGVVLVSGVTAFDVGVLHSVKRAAPFGPPPESIVSPDGRVYIQWDFHNDEYSGCAIENARPSIVSSEASRVLE